MKKDQLEAIPTGHIIIFSGYNATFHPELLQLSGILRYSCP
jgi:hypothetical protein